MDAGKRSINDIFNGNRILEIPFFQRSYVWDTPQWERFLNDMEHVSHCNKPHFLGSVILKQQETVSNQSVGDKRIIIDGQQRLTTLTIFFKVLSLKTNNQYLSGLFRLPMMNNEIALLHNHIDVTSFNKIINLEKEEAIFSEDSISQAYTYFSKNIEINKLNHQNILTNILFVGIDLVAGEDEQQIFDTINSLGVKLTTAELLKNYLFNREEIHLYNEYWQQVFEKDAETKNYWDTEIVAGRLRRCFIDLFFYAFLQIKVQDSSSKVSTEDKEEYTKVDGLFDSYKSFISKYNIDKNALMKEIKEYAQIFQQSFSPDVIKGELSDSDYIERINAIIFGLESTTLIPYVLYVLKNVTDSILRNEIFEFLESYIMRRMVCHETTKNYNQLFGGQLIANKVLSKNELKIYLDKKSDKVNFIPSNKALQEGFRFSKLTNKQAGGILYFIETKIRDRLRYSTSVNGLSNYSLEHMMPKKWENHWSGPVTQQEKDERNRILLTLGNLAIITSSLNSSIRDAKWSIKKNGQGSRSGLTHYATGLETLTPFLQLSDWNEEEIMKRADFLYEKAKEIWKE